MAADDQPDPSQKYRSAMADLARTGVPIDRYIHLFTPIEYTGRGPGFQKKYLEWIDRQINTLRENPRYRLWTTPRAGAWGGSRSSIVTRRVVLDIVGDGEGGFIVQSTDVAATLRQATIKFFEDAPLNKPVQYDVSDLMRYKDDLIKTKKKLPPRATAST